MTYPIGLENSVAYISMCLGLFDQNERWFFNQIITITSPKFLIHLIFHLAKFGIVKSDSTMIDKIVIRPASFFNFN